MEDINDHSYDMLDVDWIDLELPRRIKQFRSRSQPFTLTNEDFKLKYRFLKEYAQYIIDIVREDIVQDPRGGSISCELQVLAALRTWARNEVQDDSADIHGLSQQSITNICGRVAIALARKSKQFIKMPTTICEQEEVMSQFRAICGFRNVIGAIDCTHIKIKKVPGEVSQFYVNRKGYYSLNVQVVCDASLRIRNIVAHWRGSTHDSRIFRESSVKQRLEAGEFRGRLLGDSGYPCTSYLFTPVLNPSNEKEEHYNRAHIRTRNVVERCFGVWKQRFRCLLNGFSTSLENTKTYIVALAVLHNIAIDKGEQSDDGVPSPFIPGEPGTGSPVTFNSLQGQAARATFINQYF